jgi:predicted amidohydrolase
LQLSPVLGDLQANLEQHLGAAERAITDGADLCIFPELSLTGYFLKDLVPEVALSLGDARLKPLLELSRRADIVAGGVLVLAIVSIVAVRRKRR